MSSLHSPNLDEELNIRAIVATSFGSNPGFDALPRSAARKWRDEREADELKSIGTALRSRIIPQIRV